MTVTIGRRELLVALGGAAAAWPLAARAQQATMAMVGFLDAGSSGERSRQVAAFRKGLAESGYQEGQNVTIEYRWAEGQMERLPALAAELVRRPVAVIAAPGNTSVVLAAKAATTTIPIVFAVAEDPVRLGIVTSLARPGGNLTGVNFFNAELVAKRMELLRELVPGAVRVAVLVNPATDVANAESVVRDVDAAARAKGAQIQVFNASTSREIDAAFAALVRERLDALFVSGDGFFNSACPTSSSGDASCGSYNVCGA